MRSQVRIRVPATTANLGPGFDVLGMALDFHNEVGVVVDPGGDAPLLSILDEEDGPVPGLPLDESNYVVRGIDTAFRLAGRKRPRCSVTVRQSIPVSRGLGSSAAALVGGAFAANALMDDEIDEAEIVFALQEIEGHTEQLAAAMFGGLVAVAPPAESTPGVTRMASTPSMFSLPVAADLLVALAIPDVELETAKARSALPDSVAFSDAVFNVAAATALVTGLADGDRYLIRVGMRDRLHQDPRTALLPATSDVLAAARDAGAFGACWSGAGPTMLGLCDDDTSASEIATAMVGTFERARIEAEPVVCAVDTAGAVVLELDGEPYTPEGQDVSDDS